MPRSLRREEEISVRQKKVKRVNDSSSVGDSLATPVTKEEPSESGVLSKLWNFVASGFSFGFRNEDCKS